MNNTDRKKLERIYNCLKIPGFNSGTQSVSVTGIASYANDVKYAIDKIQNILYSMGCEELYDGETEEYLKELEEWYHERKSKNWE